MLQRGSHTRGFYSCSRGAATIVCTPENRGHLNHGRSHVTFFLGFGWTPSWSWSSWPPSSSPGERYVMHLDYLRPFPLEDLRCSSPCFRCLALGVKDIATMDTTSLPELLQQCVPAPSCYLSRSLFSHSSCHPYSTPVEREREHERDRDRDRESRNRVGRSTPPPNP